MRLFAFPTTFIGLLATIQATLAEDTTVTVTSTVISTICGCSELPSATAPAYLNTTSLSIDMAASTLTAQSLLNSSISCGPIQISRAGNATMNANNSRPIYPMVTSWTNDTIFNRSISSDTATAITSTASASSASSASGVASEKSGSTNSSQIEQANGAFASAAITNFGPFAAAMALMWAF